MRRLIANALLLALLALLVLGAWLTRHPEAGILTRARELPVVGEWAGRFQDLYRPPAPPAPLDEPPEIVFVDRHGQALDDAHPRNVEPDLVLGARPSVWVGEGTLLREQPRPGAAEIARTGGIANLRVYERRGDWFQVRHGGRLGWVYLEGYEESAEPPLGSDPRPPTPLPAQPPDPERLALARELLGDRAAVGRIGAYETLSGPTDPALLPFLDRLVGPLEAVYRERYGVVPVGEPRGAIVLFDRRADFAAYQEREESLHGLRVSGVAGGGVVAIDAEGRLREEIAATVVHELTHLLNRRALGPALPVWLEEGLADDLAHAEVDPDGALRLERLGGVTLRRPDGWEWRGALASAIALRRALDAGRLLPLADLLTLEWPDFVAPDSDQLNYAQASFWVRYLLADPAQASAFRGFLAGVAAGGPVEPEELRHRLGEEWATLDGGFARWIRIRFHEPV